MIKYLRFLCLVFLLDSCVCALEISPAHQLFVETKSGDLDLVFEIIKGKSSFVKNTNTFKLEMEYAKGGRNYLFGVFEVQNHKVDETKRIRIYKKAKLLSEYSTNEILAMNFRLLADSTKVYILPEL